VAALADLAPGPIAIRDPLRTETVGDIRTVESLSMSSCSTVSKPSMPIAAAMCFQALTEKKTPTALERRCWPPGGRSVDACADPHDAASTSSSSYGSGEVKSLLSRRADT